MKRAAIKLPTAIFTAFAPQTKIDRELGFDEVARTAMETYRDSWNPMPTCNVREFRAFFSKPNYAHIKREVMKRTKPFEPENEAVMEAMMQSFQMILPRSDETDARRTIFSAATTGSYLAQLNAHCIEKLYVDTYAAGKQADAYYEVMAGPRHLFTDDPMFVDSTDKHNCAMTDFSFQVPW